MKKIIKVLSLTLACLSCVCCFSCRDEPENNEQGKVIGEKFYFVYPSKAEYSSNWSYLPGPYPDVAVPEIRTNGEPGFIVLDFCDTRAFWINPADGIDIMDSYGYYQYRFDLFEDQMTPEEYSEYHKYYRVPEVFNRILSCGLEVTLKKVQEEGVSFYRMEIRSDDIKDEYKGDVITLRSSAIYHYTKMKIML